ncbi:MAG: DUF5010 domain-containing protein [Dehalococcoidia bacterium]|nr:DUF5010 domain-containing protein [Dehalococcoidia bacterium]
MRPEPKKRRGKRRWVIGGAVAFLALAGLGLFNSLASSDDHPRQGAEATPIMTPDPSLPPTVFAYFYYWYGLPDGTHSGALSDRPAEPDSSYENVAWFKKQFRDMNEAGVDVALAVYWGDREPSSDVGVANMGIAAQEMRAASEEPPGVGMFLDTGAIGQWPKGQRDLRKPENRDRAYGMIHTFFSTLPRSEWALVRERPVIWLWGAYFDIKFDQAFFDYVYSQFNADFGVRPYIVGEYSWRVSPSTGEPIAIDDLYLWGASLEGFRDVGVNVAEVGPGYDERELPGPGRSGRYAERENGAYYRRHFRSAIDSGKRFIAIETWNEFHEASDIADSIEFGRTYIELTRELVDEFRTAAGGD